MCRTDYVRRKVAAEKKVGDISCDLMRYKRETENLRVSFLSLKANTVYYYQTAAAVMREEEGRLDRAWAALEEEATQMEHQARGAEEEVDRLE